MKVATMSTLPLLHVTQDDTYLMCLYQECKASPEYARFFKERIAEGKFVIMDNGAAENINPSIEQLIPLYREVRPSEIILPDVVYNKEETILRSRTAHHALSTLGMIDDFQIMAVPQGNNFKEWCECLDEFLAQTTITTIGVSKFVTPKYQEEMGANTNVRLECVDRILTVASQLGRSVQIHLLGCWDNPTEIGEISRTYGDAVRGTDSGIAYVYARANQEYKGQERPDNDEIDFINGTADVRLFSRNRVAYRNACKG